ncbi:hypothetical protein CEXT_254011 [Caerostris extrusa]|uniref:Uncharacterized protein n=1 Tax=Caerostris extrusa TaxID=172846 RepID=A0AAV4NFM7_CAEEX|nr:hypothetical protein CEXT_254011 [Caerostris extrusa]
MHHPPPHVATPTPLSTALITPCSSNMGRVFVECLVPRYLAKRDVVTSKVAVHVKENIGRSSQRGVLLCEICTPCSTSSVLYEFCSIKKSFCLGTSTTPETCYNPIVNW